MLGYFSTFPSGAAGVGVFFGMNFPCHFFCASISQFHCECPILLSNHFSVVHSWDWCQLYYFMTLNIKWQLRSIFHKTNFQISTWNNFNLKWAIENTASKKLFSVFWLEGQEYNTIRLNNIQFDFDINLNMGWIYYHRHENRIDLVCDAKFRIAVKNNI